jgi:hypothetical protein
MWKIVRCQILHNDKKGLKFNKIDNKIWSYYQEKDLLLPINQPRTVSSATCQDAFQTTKEAHLLSFKLAKLLCLEAISQDPDNLENVVNSGHRKYERKKSKPMQTPTS